MEDEDGMGMGWDGGEGRMMRGEDDAREGKEDWIVYGYF